MGRLRKGQPLPGEYRNCAGCAKTVYRAPSKLHYLKVICSKECYRKISFSFPCAVCKTPVYTQPAQLRLRARKTCSQNCRRVILRDLALEKQKRLGHTKHQLDRMARYSAEAAEWRQSVFQRDNFTCQTCQARGTYLEADHIKPWAYFPELRFELSNGRTLCRPCHDQTKIGAKAMREIYAPA